MGNVRKCLYLYPVIENKLKKKKRDYNYTSSVTAMTKDLNWRPLDRRHIDSPLIMLYRVTYDLVAIPASQYLTRNTRPSKHIHPLSYRQIPTLNEYYRYYRFTFSQGQLFIGMPCQPTHQSFPSWRCSAVLFAR